MVSLLSRCRVPKMRAADSMDLPAAGAGILRMRRSLWDGAEVLERCGKKGK